MHNFAGSFHLVNLLIQINVTCDLKKNPTLTTVIPKTITNAKEPKPMTTTAMAQSGIPPTSSSAMEGACSSLATTEKKIVKAKVFVRQTRSSSLFQSWNSTTHTYCVW